MFDLHVAFVIKRNKTVIDKSCNLIDGDVAYTYNRSKPSLINRFSDQGKISQSLREHVAIAVEQGYMTGTNIGFELQKPLTCAEACALLSRIIRQTGTLEKVPM